MRPKKNSGDLILGGNQLAILQIIFRLKNDAYAGLMYVRHHQDEGKRIALPRIYSVLGKLEGKGLVTHSIVKPEGYQTGRPRKVYTLTPKGLKVLNLSLQENPRLGRGQGWAIPGLGGKSKA